MMFPSRLISSNKKQPCTYGFQPREITSCHVKSYLLPSATKCVSARGGGRFCQEGGGCLPRGCILPPVDRKTDACENITFPLLLLQTVTRKHSSRMRTALLPTVSQCIPFLGGGMSGDIPWTYPPPGRDQIPEISTSPQKGHGARDTNPTLFTDTSVKNITFPNFVGGR